MPLLRRFVAVSMAGMVPMLAFGQPHPQMEAICAANPERCEELRHSIETKCAADPKACEERKAALRKRAAEWKAKCDADPKACEAKKKKLRERLQQKRTGN
jgi:hypothetical protein